MRLANGTGSVYKMPGNRRNPYIVTKTIGWELDMERERAIQKRIVIGYASTKEAGLKLLEDYNSRENKKNERTDSYE